ncbi:MAG TPA: tetratricopeptide repeat protein [Sphingomonadaceae bacterium]|nr:tetratricopeptide repeat protein [Sphingomonadaceae bacterium]
MRFGGWAGWIAALAAWSFAAPLQAESLYITGTYPAGADATAGVNSIAVENFGGVDGPALSIRIEDRLRAVEVEGRPWFALLPARGGGEVDAVLRGTATADTRFEDITLKRKRCARYDEQNSKKCVEHKEVDARCLSRMISLNHSIRLVSWRGEQLYARDGAPSQQLSYCPRDDDNVKSAESTIAELLDGVASDLRFQFAPLHERRAIRVMESRKGLKGEAAKAFQRAVKITSTDPEGACREWDGLAEAAPAQLSIAFNRGLCEEMRGDLDLAAEHYRSALKLSPGHDYPEQGLARIEGRHRAEEQLQEHWGE